MLPLLATVLIVNGVFNIVVWPMFLRRVVKDPRARTEQGKATPFLRVHLILVSIALLIGLTSIVLAVVALTQGA